MFKSIGYHSVAKVIVVLEAYILHFLLGNTLSVAEYGVIGTIITFCNFYYMFLTNGARQAISKSIASGQYDARDVLKKGFLFQLVFGIVLALLNFALAPLFAQLFGDETLTAYFRQLSILILATGIYFALTGGLNGVKLFLAEAIVTAVYPLLRLSAVPLSMIMERSRPSGVIWGFTLASVLSAILTAVFLKSSKVFSHKPEQPKVLTYKGIAKSSVEFISFFAVITIVLNLDTFFLQYVHKDMVLTGLYTGVHTFSLVPYYLVSAFYLVILPYVAEKWAAGDKEGVRELIKKNCHILYMFVLPIVVLISLTAAPLLASFYSEEYREAGSALSILCFGTFLLSFYAMLSVVLNGIEKKRFSIVLSLIVFAVDAVLLFVLIPFMGLNGAALATSIASTLGCAASYVLLHKTLGGLASPKVVLKCLASVGICGVLCVLGMTWIPLNGLIPLMLFYAALAVVYVVCLMLLKALDLKSLLSKKGA